MGIPLKSPQRTAVPRTQLPRTQLRHGQLPSNQALESRPSVVDNVDHTSTMKSIVRKRREFYNTKAGDSGNVVQPKKFHPAELHPDSRKDVEGTYPYTKAASSQLVVDPGLPQNSGTQLQPNTCHPAEAQPDSGKNLRGTSSSTNAASAQPGSDLNKGHSASSSTNSLIVKPLNIIKKRYPPQSAANPPQGRLPSLPSQRPSLYSNAEESSLASTYGDTASLLNLSVQGEVNVDESGASRNILTSEPVNGRASIAGTGDVKTRIQSSNALFTPPNEIRFRPTSTFDTSNRSSGRISFIHSNGSVHSRPLSVQEAGVLERQIQAAVGRMGRTSGESSRFSILTFHEEARSGSGYDDQISNSSGELILDLGPGGSQSTSSHGPLSLSATVHSDEEDVAVFSKYRSSHGSSEAATAAMMWADLCDEEAATSPLDGINAIESRGRGRIIGEMDDEGGVMINPETVEENRRIPRQTHLYTLARLTGSSVAGFSGSAEGSEDEGTERTPSSQHGDRRRYTRPSRLERDGQSGHLILRPEYTFTGGAGFPHRDALTPSQANLFSNSSYQHPTPLSTDHVHPFRSSPPLINRAGASQHSYADSQTSDGSLPMDDDENYVLKPNTYSGQDTLHRADTYFNSDRTLRADTYSSPDLYLHPNTYSRPEQYSRDTYSRQGCGVYQSEVDENLASGSRSNGDRTRYHQREANCVSSAEANALEEFYENKEFQNFINRNGSEANMMGRQSKPKVTRTPMRTGMHDNTNFLAAYDHSYTPFHTNRYELYLNLENLDQQQSLAPHTHHTSSHRRVGANRPQLYQPYRETSWNFSSPREYGFTHDLLREHRRVLAAANLLPRAFTPPTPNHHLTPLHLASLDFSSTASGGSSIRAVGPAGPSSGPTSLPPRCGGAQPMERRRFVPAPHLIPNRRPSAAVLNRQRNLGAAIIAVMGVCPPLLLIVGLGKSHSPHCLTLPYFSKANASSGGMDATLASAMRGEVAGFTEAQKKVALGLGVGGTLGVLLGAIGAIIYLVLHH